MVTSRLFIQELSLYWLLAGGAMSKDGLRTLMTIAYIVVQKLQINAINDLLLAKMYPIQSFS